MKWKGWVLTILVTGFISIASFKVGTYAGVVIGYDYGVTIGKNAQDKKIKGFCDGDHQIYWGDKGYRCVPGISL